MKTAKTTFSWTACGSGAYLNGEEPAKSVLGALRAAKEYADGELMGEGKITIYRDGEVIRVYEAGALAGTQRFNWKRTDIGL